VVGLDPRASQCFDSVCGSRIQTRDPLVPKSFARTLFPQCGQAEDERNDAGATCRRGTAPTGPGRTTAGTVPPKPRLSSS